MVAPCCTIVSRKLQVRAAASASGINSTVTNSRTPASTLPDLDSRGTRKMYTTSTKAIEGVGQGPGKFTLDVGKAHQQATDLGRKECKYINEMTWSILVVICHFMPTVHCTYL